MKLPRIILGANPFHGISYRSRENRNQYRERFSSVDNVLKIINKSFELGVRGIHVFTTDIQIEAIVRAKEKLGDELIVVSIMPDLYSAAARQTGAKANETTSKLKQLLKNMPALVQAGLTGDLKKIIDKVFNTEMEIVKKTHPNFILLHGFLVDIACAAGQKYGLEVFKEKVTQLGAVPGINSHNYGRTHAMLKEMNIHFPVVQTSFNARGYMMNPSRQSCIEALNNSNSVTHIAKKVLAGGVIPPVEAFKYIFNELNLPSASVGVASIEEAEETFSAASQVLGGDLSQSIEVNESD
jgi:hypothetical protein